MPGLSQLKQFEKDLLTLGDETSLRAARGEKPVLVPIPKGITVDNDAEDFVLGMPEKPLEKSEKAVDDDLSDITGSKKSSDESGAESDSFGPDLSSLLAPVDVSSGDDGSSQEMPDLSMFMDSPEPETKVEETPVQEKPELSVADMGLDALLGGLDFSESNNETQNELLNEIDNTSSEISEIDPDEFLNDTKPVISEKPKAASNPKTDIPDIADITDDFSMPEEINQKSDSKKSDDAFGFNQLGIENIDFDDIPGASNGTTSTDNPNPSDDLNGIPSGLFDSKDFEVPDINDSEISETGSFDEPGNIPDFGFDDDSTVKTGKNSENLSDFDSESSDFSADEFADIDLNSINEPAVEKSENKADEKESVVEDLGGIFDQNSLSDDFDSMEKDSDSSVPVDFDTDIGDLDSLDTDVPDFNDQNDFSSDSENGSSEEPLEIFDTTGMEDMDFGIPDTDSALNDGAAASGESELEDFNTDFEIPGFSDVDTVKEPKQKPLSKNSNLDVPDFSKGIPGVELPPNTLSEEQYKTFLKNFSEYPLNVRLAFEDLIVQNEFTDDAEFEVIEKILRKAPARQVAGMLEKMLDTSIPVPRDYEHRTAEEYAAYKKSIQYQLRNKILPGILVAALAVLVCWGLFNFTKNCIYIPAKASKYYKQGYTLLQADEYEQAQMKFDKAASYKMKKKWFFNFARGYREHKQYYRAADIYQKILYYFDHDKQAGLEYADMELNDLSNYSNAEEIVRRQLLDYHVNDADGILMLGDVFLEWGTEKDPSKLEYAKEQYLKLLQLYKPNNLYNSRMMRYYIRSDNLQQVIGYQKMFEQNEKSLSAEDWTELGGYLLEKMYGPLTPAEEPLRMQIEGLRALLQRAVKMDPENPTALYNLANYYINSNEIRFVEATLKKALDKFNKAKQLNKREIYRYIDTYRLLGEDYVKTNDYLQAQEQYTAGITLFTTEKENADFEGTPKIGKLYADLADINYMLAGDYDNAAVNYKKSVELGNDSPSIRYRLGYMSYKKKNYQEALGSFMKAGEGNTKERNLLFSMANTLALRNDDYAAEGYYDQLISELDNEVEKAGGSLFPQTNVEQYDIVNLYMYAANNYGVVLHKIAQRTGNSQKNAQSIVQFQQSLRAWDSITRNQTTMTRLEGSNLAEENIKYVTHPVADFEPSIYLEIPKTLSDSEKL